MELERSDCDLEWLTWHQEHLEILPAFAWDFITFVTDNQHSILQNWRIVFDTERRMNSLKLETPRFVECYAMFKAAVETFKAYLNASGCMSEAEIDTLTMADIDAIGKLIKENDDELIDRPDEVLLAECADMKQERSWIIPKVHMETDKYCDKIGTSHKSSHKSRKTYISSLIDAGVNLNTIREAVGHCDERTTLQSYCFDRSTEEEKIARFEEALA